MKHVKGGGGGAGGGWWVVGGWVVVGGNISDLESAQEHVDRIQVLRPNWTTCEPSQSQRRDDALGSHVDTEGPVCAGRPPDTPNSSLVMLKFPFRGEEGGEGGEGCRGRNRGRGHVWVFDQ